MVFSGCLQEAGAGVVASEAVLGIVCNGIFVLAPRVNEFLVEVTTVVATLLIVVVEIGLRLIGGCGVLVGG